MEVAEIVQAITDSPDLKSGLIAAIQNDVFTAAKSSGIIVRTPEEETAFLKTYETTKIDPRVREIYDGLDTDIETITGVKRQDKEKTFEYNKRVLGSLKTELATAKTELEAAKSGKIDELTAQQLNQLKATVTEKEKALADLEKASKETTFDLKRSFSVKTALAGAKVFVPAHVPDDQRDAYVSARLSYIECDFANRYKAEETDKGELVYKGADGTILTNASTASPKTAAEIIKDAYKFEFEQEEAGAAGAGSSGKGGKNDLSTAGIKDKQGIYEFAAKKGLVKGSDEWFAEVEKLQKDLNIK